jgi:Uma2 family endonuclease
MAEQVKTRMTADEFSQLPETNQPTELINGELIVSPSPLVCHQLSSSQFFRLIDGLKPNGTLFYSPMDVYFDQENIPQPDLIWVAETSRCVIGEKRLEGPPDLIVEILSPGTSRMDRREKFQLYERYGVSEYWMVDPLEKYVEVYRWVGGRYDRLGIFGEGDTLISAALGGKTVSLTGVFEG